MWQTIKNAFADKDIRRRIFLTIGVLFLFRIGSFIPLPGIDYAFVEKAMENNQIFEMMSMMSGGALQYGTLFALGILPFINSFIIMQLLTLIIPPLERLSKQGDDGREKITTITRYVAIALAVIQSIGIIVTFNNAGAIQATFGSVAVTAIMLIIMLTAGSTLVMWLGERITEYGIGNGTSLIIFVGIISGLGTGLVSASATVKDNYVNIFNIIGYLLLIVLLFIFIVFVDGSERRIKVNYAKQVKGNKMYGGQSTFIPIKVNSSGVMPIIFASSFMMFPQMIVSFIDQNSSLVSFYYRYLSPYGNYWVGNLVYYLIMFLLIIFFAYFYAQIQFNPQDVARNLQQYGGTIQGVRPGKATSEYLAKINNRITLFGALFLAFIAIIPVFLFRLIGEDIGLTNAFSATGMLIVVSVALEFDKQLESQIMMRHYKGFLK
ncbi:MAG: preprotein translocase subunit SecY [Clostridia bacterium]|nr:preprotein translocase subunit SecY [Clostridia bacterium]MDY4083055.1 preprotein translocase subunit SecY [Eubacteriales bacterium]